MSRKKRDPEPEEPPVIRGVPRVSRELLLSRLAIVPSQPQGQPPGQPLGQPPGQAPGQPPGQGQAPDPAPAARPVPAPHPAPAFELSMVIVNYRSRAALTECLGSLEVDTGGIAKETVVVDNESSAEAAAAIGRDFPRVRTIANPENVGFARAVNQGIAATTGEYVLLVNPDCFIERGSIPAMLGYLRSHPRTGMVGPRMIGRDGRLQYSARGFPDHLTFLFNRYSILTRLFPRNPWSRRYLLSDWDHASLRPVDWLSGACMLVRRTAIDEVGPMDEAFFMFNEDVDWCRRMKTAGWEVVYVPDALVRHDIGASRRKVPARIILERHRGMIHYFHKHHPTNPVLSFLADTLIRLRGGLMLVANAVRFR
jgi:GT2 family glycosyltransferase